MAGFMEHDTIQHPGNNVPVAYFNTSIAFSERAGSLIGRVTQTMNLHDALGRILPGSICISERG